MPPMIKTSPLRIGVAVCPERRVSIVPAATISPLACAPGADFCVEAGNTAAMAAMVAAKTEKAQPRRPANEYSITSPLCTGYSLGVVPLPAQISAHPKTDEKSEVLSDDGVFQTCATSSIWRP